MTITEAAKTVKKSRQTIYNYIEQGKLKASRNGKGFEVELEDLLDAFEMSKNTSNKTNNVSSDSSKFDTSMSNDEVSNEMSIYKYVDTLIKQQDEKDRQIQELHQIVAMQQKSLDKLTEQNQLLLEDTRNQPSFFQRLKARFAS